MLEHVPAISQCHESVSWGIAMWQCHGFKKKDAWHYFWSMRQWKRETKWLMAILLKCESVSWGIAIWQCDESWVIAMRHVLYSCIDSCIALIYIYIYIYTYLYIYIYIYIYATRGIQLLNACMWLYCADYEYMPHAAFIHIVSVV